MHLKKLEILGFKSFAKKTILDFDKNNKDHGITCIVGPNGSGKSNIADAVRWVLGEQSYKNLRSKKSEEVVFAGSEKKSRSSYAEVSLLLDNKDKKAPIEFSEVLISRRLYRNGEGEYLINQSKVRLFDIQELLAKSGFGRSSYTVINQGMVDQILFYGAEDKKILFSEAVGVKQYELKKEQAFRKLESTEQNLIRARDILYELEPRLKNLRSQAKKAQDKNKIQENLLKVQRDYYQFTWGKLEEESKEKKENLNNLEKELIQIEKEYSNLSTNLEGSFSQEEDKYKELQKIRAEIEKLQDDRGNIKEKLIELSGKMEVQKALKKFDAKEFLDEDKEFDIKINKLKSQLTSLVSEKKNLAKKIGSKDNELKIKNEKFSELQRRVYNFQKQSNDIDLKLVSKEIKMILEDQDNLLKRLKVCRNAREISLLFNQANLIRKKMVVLYKKVSKNGQKGFSDLDKIQQELNSLLKEKDALFGDVQELKLKLQILEMKEKKTVDEIERINIKKNEFKNKLSKVKEIKSKESSFGNLSKEINELKKQLFLKEKKIEIEKERLKSKEQIDRNIEKRISTLRGEMVSKQKLISQFQTEITDVKVELARLETRQNDLEKEMKEEIEKSVFEEIKLKKYRNISLEEKESLEKKITRLKNKLFGIGEVDSSIDQEFKEVEDRFSFLSSQSLDLEEAKENLKKVIFSLDKKIKTQFDKTFADISYQFNKYFKLLFNGGGAKLILDSENGIEITVNPPGKRVKSLNALSGGERSLTSISLICAILFVNPSPFCVLDEVDAALDESNTYKFLNILDDLSKRTQFIIITHNRETMKKADLLYGVTMDNSHISSLLSLKLQEV